MSRLNKICFQYTCSNKKAHPERRRFSYILVDGMQITLKYFARLRKYLLPHDHHFQQHSTPSKKAEEHEFG
jgi:hypothetical protein